MVTFCYAMWNLFTVVSLQFCNDSAIASLEANQNRPKLRWLRRYSRLREKYFITGYPSRHTTSATPYRRLIDVQTTSCVYWDADFRDHVKKSFATCYTDYRDYVKNGFVTDYAENAYHRLLWLPISTNNNYLHSYFLQIIQYSLTASLAKKHITHNMIGFPKLKIFFKFEH